MGSYTDLVKNSSLYREFQAEREEILKHKWIESERAGYDVGFEQALTDWIIKHRRNWRKSRQARADDESAARSDEERGKASTPTPAHDITSRVDEHS